MKPIKKEIFFIALDEAIEKVVLDKEELFVVKTDKGLHSIILQSIIYCEYKNHTVTFNLRNGQQVVSRNFRENFSSYVKTIINKPYFVKTHSAFIVNMSLIKIIHKNSVTLKNNMQIPISKYRYSKVRELYMVYVSNLKQ